MKCIDIFSKILITTRQLKVVQIKTVLRVYKLLLTPNIPVERMPMVMLSVNDMEPNPYNSPSFSIMAVSLFEI